MTRRSTKQPDDLTVAMDAPEVVVAEERLSVGTKTKRAGSARPSSTSTSRASAAAWSGAASTRRPSWSRWPDAEADSGQVETLPDGSLSIPCSRSRSSSPSGSSCRERVVVRKHTVYEEHVVTADLKRERLEVEAEGDVVVARRQGAAVTTPDGRTPAAPDQAEGEVADDVGDADDGRTPSAPDQAEGDDSSAS
jgi:hypothetical protein